MASAAILKKRRLVVARRLRVAPLRRARVLVRVLEGRRRPPGYTSSSARPSDSRARQRRAAAAASASTTSSTLSTSSTSSTSSTEPVSQPWLWARSCGRATAATRPAPAGPAPAPAPRRRRPAGRRGRRARASATPGTRSSSSLAPRPSAGSRAAGGSRGPVLGFAGSRWCGARRRPVGATAGARLGAAFLGSGPYSGSAKLRLGTVRTVCLIAARQL